MSHLRLYFTLWRIYDLSLSGSRAMSNQTINDETALLIVSCTADIHQKLCLVIDPLNEQARVLKRLVGKRIRPTNDERRQLAVLARKMERRLLKA